MTLKQEAPAHRLPPTEHAQFTDPDRGVWHNRVNDHFCKDTLGRASITGYKFNIQFYVIRIKCYLSLTTLIALPNGPSIVP